MLKKPRTLLIVVAAAFFLVGMILFGAARNNSPSYQKCQADYEAEGTSQKQIESNSLSLGRIFAPKCTVIFLDQHSGFVTAVATALLTLVTGGLVVVGYLQIKTARAQLRAYVVVEQAILNDGATPPNIANPAQNGCPTVTVTIKNFGATPAYDVRHNSALGICQAGQERTLNAPADISHEAPTIIAPSHHTFMMRNLGRVVTPFEVGALAIGGMVIKVYGKITYRDAFGINHTTDYSLSFAGNYPPFPMGILMFTNEGNKAD